METRTKELPLVRPSERNTAPLPLVQASGAGQTRPLPPLPPAAAGPPGPPPFPAPVAPVPREAAAGAPPPAPVYPQVGAAPRARAPRRWPVALASWLGGMVAGMLLLTLALGLFGGPRTLSAVGTGDPAAAWDTSITITDAYLTAQARKGGTGQVQEPTLRVQADGTIAMAGKVALLGRGVPLTATLQPSLVDGKLQMAVVNLQVGGLPLPQALIDQIAGGVAGATQPPGGGMPATPVRLEATEGKLVIYSKLQ